MHKRYIVVYRHTMLGNLDSSMLACSITARVTEKNSGTSLHGIFHGTCPIFSKKMKFPYNQNRKYLRGPKIISLIGGFTFLPGKGVFGGTSGTSREGPGVGHKIVSDTKQMTNKREKKRKK